MTALPAAAPVLRPPPGPLTWLHPELHELRWWIEVETGAGAGDGGEVLDLGRRPLVGAELRDALRAHPVWRLPAGPLSLSLRQTLVPEAPGPKLELAGPGERPRSVEGALSLWARELEEAGQLVAFECVPQASGWTRTPIPIDVRCAERRASERSQGLWICPLPSGGRWLEVLHRTVAAAPEVFRAARLTPLFAPENPSAGAHPARTRLAPSWWGLLPGDVYPADARRAVGELWRWLWPERALTFAAFESYACAGIDLYADALRGRRDAGVVVGGGPEREPRPLIFVVCGIDGSGKSSHCEALRTFLEERGLSCAVRKIFRHGLFHDTVTDLTRSCAGGRHLHLWRLQRLAKVLDSLKILAQDLEDDWGRYDALVFDRYTFTHLAAARGRYHHDPWVRELLARFPPADRVYLLDLPAEDADRRIGTRAERTVDENPYMLDRYRQVLLDLADREGFTVLDARAPFEANRAAIRADAGALLAARGSVG